MILSHLVPLSRSQATTLWCARTAIRLRTSKSTIRSQHIISSSSLPRIAQSSIWESIFPKSLREKTKDVFRAPQRRPRNPATYFIWIYILIGSQAIKILGIRNEYNAYMRRAELKLDKLREVVEKLQKGEPVDVEKALGSGDEEQENEWEEALKEIENEERAWQEGKRKRQEAMDRSQAEIQDASPVSIGETKAEAVPDLPSTLPRPPPSQPGFY